MEVLPDEIITLISKYLSIKEKERMRQVNKEFDRNIRLMDIKINKMNDRIDSILDGRVYILNRLRLAALCGMRKKRVASIWNWIENINYINNNDVLHVLRDIDSVLKETSSSIK